MLQAQDDIHTNVQGRVPEYWCRYLPFLHLLGPRLRRLGLGRGLVANFFFWGASTAAAGALATTKRSAGDDHWHCAVLDHRTSINREKGVKKTSLIFCI